ncbi:hypothetical protein BV22DRAFT_92336 [Leucogyrophana mollusca]|uniref:Uncharacterized protein n=1 Tax=Leucogyrophana mollusca TaxID=85980 RepID=A0ACB8BVF3_9AGAM|nr:hypothetical protein BV22DRAFT_92336 [Leucogyrophana mollusca]
MDVIDDGLLGPLDIPLLHSLDCIVDEPLGLLVPPLLPPTGDINGPPCPLPSMYTSQDVPQTGTLSAVPSRLETMSSLSSPSISSHAMTSTSSSSTGTPSTTFTSSIVPPKTSPGSLSLTSGVQTSFSEETTTAENTPAMIVLPTLNQASSTITATALPVTALPVTALAATALSTAVLPASPTTSVSPSSRSAPSTRNIVIVITSVAGLFLIAVLIFYALRRRPKKSKYEAVTIVPYAFAQPSAQVHSVKQGLHMGTSPLVDSHSDVYSLSSQTFLTSGNEWEASDESTGTLTRLGSSARERLLRKIYSLVRREVAKNKHSVRSNSIAE